jgi:hypothetical protein
MTTLREEALRHAPEALLTIVGLMRTASSETVMLAAAREILDRATGRPRIEGAGTAGKSLEDLLGEVRVGVP